MRKFEEVRDEFKVFPDVETKLPERSDSRSAGYDLHSKEDYVLQPGESHTFGRMCVRQCFLTMF